MPETRLLNLSLALPLQDPYNNPQPTGSATFASVFNGTSPNGTWSLYVMDDGGGGGNSTIGSWCLTISVPPNLPPVVTTSAGITAFTEGNNVTSTPVIVDATITVTDDGVTLASGTVSITGNFQNGQDILAFTNNGSTMGNITGSYIPGTGVLTLTSSGATSTVAQWQAALRSVTYTNSSNTPNTTNRTISFVVNDGVNNSNTATKTVSVTAVNDDPVITSNGGNTTAALSIAENTTAVTTVTATDADGTTPTYSIAGGADAAKFAINTTTGVLIFLAAPDFETPMDANADNAYIVIVRASDGTASDEQTITITITDASEGVILTNASPSALIDFSASMPATVGTNPQTAFAGAGFSPDPTTAGRLNSNAWAVTGWSDGALPFGGTNITGDYARGSVNTAQTTGGMYAYTGTPGSVANPSLMIQPGGGDFAPGTLTLKIQNKGTQSVKQLAVSYNLFVRNDQARSNSFNFSHSPDNTTYTPVATLDYTSPEVADVAGWVLVSAAPSRSTTITGLNIPPNGVYYLRWSGNDVGGTGSRDEFGLDDINISATFDVILPVNLGSVKAYQQGSNIQIEWTAQTEMNLEKYEVEESQDARQFIRAATVAARGLNTGTMYKWLDVNVNNGNNYYRIKAISKNGETQYSKVVNVNMGSAVNEIAVYPNPFDDNTISLSFNLRKGKYTITLVDRIGKQVYKKEIVHGGGAATQTLQPGIHLPQGIYQLTLSDGHNRYVQQLLKK